MNENDMMDVPIRMEWKVQCRIACQAMIHKTTFNEMANYFLKTRMQQIQQERMSHARGRKR